MPKVKTHSRAKKMFKLTSSGKIKYNRCNKRHLLSKKTKARKKRLSKAGYIGMADVFAIRRLLRLR